MLIIQLLLRYFQKIYTDYFNNMQPDNNWDLDQCLIKLRTQTYMN